MSRNLSETVFERLLRELPFAYGRTRLMRMRPKILLSIHVDPTRRYHFALVTNPVATSSKLPRKMVYSTIFQPTGNCMKWTRIEHTRP